MSRTQQTQDALRSARAQVPRESRWTHKKGGLYTVVGHALHTETGTAVVLYSRFGGPGYDQGAEEGIIFARPVEMWSPDRFTPYSAP